MFSVIGDVPVDSDALVVTWSISKCAGIILSKMLIGIGFAYVYLQR